MSSSSTDVTSRGSLRISRRQRITVPAVPGGGFFLFEGRSDRYLYMPPTGIRFPQKYFCVGGPTGFPRLTPFCGTLMKPTYTAADPFG